MTQGKPKGTNPCHAAMPRRHVCTSLDCTARTASRLLHLQMHLLQPATCTLHLQLHLHSYSTACHSINLARSTSLDC